MILFNIVSGHDVPRTPRKAWVLERGPPRQARRHRPDHHQPARRRQITNPRYGTVEALADVLGLSTAVVMRAIRQTVKESGRMTPDEIPAVCFIDDVAQALRCSTTTIKRRLRVGTFPIRPLPSIDSRRRWAGEDVRQFIARAPGRLRRVG